eukprot:scaffold15041_cov206-Skeletonema_marinoi.AAC.1
MMHQTYVSAMMLLRTRKKKESDDSSVRSISFYCNDYDSGGESDYEGHVENSNSYTHSRLIERELNTTDNRLLDARLVSRDSILSDGAAVVENDATGATATNQQETYHGNATDRHSQQTVLRLIQGSLLGGDGTYQNVYSSDADDTCEDTHALAETNDVEIPEATEKQGPTLRGVARQVLKEENKRLDEKQYIMYEVIACSFLLGLLRDSNYNEGESLALQNLLRGAAGQGIINDLKALEDALKAKGGREQLIMFVTGFAGAGKSTAINVAQKFCYEFCKAASIMWNDNTYLFTAYTGSAAAAFGGQTTVAATYLNKKTISVGNLGYEWEYGVINIAAFLAHAMTSSIKYDACDEFHTDQNTDVDAVKTPSGEFYAISNSCGQYGFNYVDYHCEEDERHMECAVDKNMNLQATTSQIYPSAPPPLSCRPRSVSESYTGYWDVGTGKEMVVFPYENSFGRTDTEGCCYWGRGAIHTRGICNIGKLNYFLGKKVSSMSWGWVFVIYLRFVVLCHLITSPFLSLLSYNNNTKNVRLPTMDASHDIPPQTFVPSLKPSVQHPKARKCDG